MSSTNPTTVTVEIAGTEISFETGKVAKQASGSVVVRQGEEVRSRTMSMYKQKGEKPVRESVYSVTTPDGQVIKRK